MCGSHKTLKLAGIKSLLRNIRKNHRHAARGRSRARGGATHSAAHDVRLSMSSERPPFGPALSVQSRCNSQGAHSERPPFWPPSPASMPACTHWPFAAPRRLWQRLLSDPGRPRLSPHVLSHTCRHIRLRLDPPPTRLPAPRRAPLRPSWRGAGRHPLAQSRARGSSGRGSGCRGASSGASGRRRAASAPS